MWWLSRPNLFSKPKPIAAIELQPERTEFVGQKKAPPWVIWWGQNGCENESVTDRS